MSPGPRGLCIGEDDKIGSYPDKCAWWTHVSKPPGLVVLLEFVTSITMLCLSFSCLP